MQNHINLRHNLGISGTRNVITVGRRNNSQNHSYNSGCNTTGIGANSFLTTSGPIGKNEDLFAVKQKNECLWSEVNMYKHKYMETYNENKKLKQLVVSNKNSAGGIKYNNTNESLVTASNTNTSTHVKSQSWPKNNYITCSTGSSSGQCETSLKYNNTLSNNYNNQKNVTIPNPWSISTQSIPGINTICCSNSANNILNQNHTVLSALPTLVINFLNQMKELQDSISKKVDNVKDLKKQFELKKRELTKIAEKLSSCSNGAQEHTNTNHNFKPSVYTTPGTQINSITSSPKNKSLKSCGVTMITANKPINKVSKHTGFSLYSTKSSLSNDAIKELENTISTLKSELSLRDQKIQNEKLMTTWANDKYNDEKWNSKAWEDKNAHLVEKIGVLTKWVDSQKETIDDIQKMNMSLMENTNKQKEKIEQLSTEVKNTGESNDTLNTEIKAVTSKVESLNTDKIKLEFEASKLKNEVQKYKEQWNEQVNNNKKLTLLNENIIKEKDNAINELNQKNERLTKEIADDKSKIDSFNSTSNSSLKAIQKENDAIKIENEKIMKLNTEYKSENKELKDKIAEIKNEYWRRAEEIENVKTLLIEMNSSSLERIEMWKEKLTTGDCTREENKGKSS